MNERIKQLAEQAVQTISYRIDPHTFKHIDDPAGLHIRLEFDKEKFAELIVRECLDQCYNRGMNDELYAGQLKAAAYIEEHFGVKS